MRKLHLAALALLCLTACHSSRTSSLQATLSPAGDVLTVTCDQSSTGKCHLAFEGAATPSVLTLRAGQSVTVLHVAVGTSFCAEAHRVSLDSCAKSPVLLTRQTITKKSTSSAPTS